MPLFNTTPVEEDTVRQIAAEHWSLKLVKCLQASQNHTFLATSEEDPEKKFVLRVTPDPENKRFACFEVETQLLRYVHARGLSVCPPVPSKSGAVIVRAGPLTVVAYPFATGEPVIHTDWVWLNNQEHVRGLGRWMARLHQLSKQFSTEHPDVVLRHWDSPDLHEGILAGAPIAEEDLASQKDPELFGIIHGDINPTNFYWNPDVNLPCVFDWDQIQKSWFTYDIAQPIWGVVLMKGAGHPVDRTPVPGADVERYTNWFLEGYEGESKTTVDRQALQRMLRLRKELYQRFVTKAVHELPPEHPMGQFCKYIIDWLDRDDPFPNA